MTMRLAIFWSALLLTGCGQFTPPADMPTRTWKYYVDHPGEIQPMQKICLEWAGSSAPAEMQPAVIGTNCRAAAYAKAQLQLRQ